jgi:hypothetical protein
MCQLRISARIALAALSLIAGLKFIELALERFYRLAIYSRCSFVCLHP